MAPRERSEILRACWQTLVDHTDELATLITTEHGKPLADARAEVAYSAEFFRWNAEEAVRIHGSLGRAPSGANRIIVHHPPVGVVVIVTPWNFPAAMITRKLAPALAAGNAVGHQAPGTHPADRPAHRRTAARCRRAGGRREHRADRPSSGAWFDAAVDHPATRMVSFTGSTEVGITLLKRAADRVLKSVMELGGNAPFIVFDDADIDAAVEGAMVAKMRHSAETCTAANRFFVHAAVAEEFTAKLSTAMGAIRIGNGMDAGVTCGPMINAQAIDTIDELVHGAVDGGATVSVGGKRGAGAGYFYEPTVLGNVAPMRRSPDTRSSVRWRR